MAQIPLGFQVVATRGYSTQGPAGAGRTLVDGGMARYALDYDRGSQQFSCALILDMLQWQVWESFYLLNIKKGTLPFEMYLDSGMGPALHTVMIVPGSYSVNLDLVKYASVSFQVEAESQIYANPDHGAALVILYDIYGTSTPDLLAAIAYLANVSSNALDY